MSSAAPSKIDTSDGDLRGPYDVMLLEYFTQLEARDPALYSTLRDVVCGSIIATALYSDYFQESTRRFERTAVYLDTNIVFSLLELDYDEYSKPAAELFKLMRLERAFDCRVFDFTVHEIIRVLQAYQSEAHRYVGVIRVGSIHGSLRARGWTAADVRQFITKIEVKLWEKGISIDGTGIDSSAYHAVDESLQRELQHYKPYQSLQGQNHDLAAIEFIERYRGRSVRRIEKSKAFFLTSDLRLARCVLYVRRHGEDATIPEVIADRLLTNILWLKRPSFLRKLPLESIISMISRTFFVDKAVWREFYDTVSSLRRSGDIRDKDVSILLYDQQMQNALHSFDSDSASRINRDWILENVARARSELDAEHRLTTAREVAVQSETFAQELSDLEKEQNRRWAEKVDSVKQGIQQDARLAAKQTASLVFWSALVGVVLCALIGFPLVITNWQVVEPYTYVTGIILGFVYAAMRWMGVDLNPRRIRIRLELRLFNRLYASKLRSSRITELESQASESTADELRQGTARVL